MEDDEAEMAALRARSQRYQQHLRVHGSRAEVRARREQLSEVEERRAEQELQRQEEAERLRQPRLDDDADDANFGPPPPPPLLDGGADESKTQSQSYPQRDAPEQELVAEEEDGRTRALRAMLPMSFGAQPKSKPSIGSLHLKRKRPGINNLGSGFSVNLADRSNAVKLEPGAPQQSSPAAPVSEAGAGGSAPTSRKRKVDTGGPPEAADHNGHDGRAVAGDDVDDDEDHDDDVDSEEDSDNPYELPISHEVILEGHGRACSALALDPSGSRLISGGYDYQWQMYAFSGMDSTMRPFRNKEPDEGHQIRQLRYDRRGNRFLCVTGSAQPKVFDREGIELAQFVRGDMYLHDLRHTSGHVSGVNDGCWSSTEEELVVTGGQDGTVRFWSVDKPKKNLHVTLYKNRQGLRQCVTAIAMNHNGSLLAAAGTDGGLQLFPVGKYGAPGLRPSHRAHGAHVPDTETSSLCWSRDNHTLLSRGGDHTLKLWDARKFVKPVQVVEGLRNDCAQTDVMFSPNEQLVLTPTSADRSVKTSGDAEDQGQGGRLCFFDRRTLQPVESIRLGPSSGIRAAWNSKINQIFVSRQDGKILGFYDPALSTNGALLCAARRPRAVTPGEELEYLDIITPHSLKLFRPEPSERKRQKLARKDPVRSQKPLPPVEGQVGRDGRVQNLKLNQYFMKQVLAKETAALPPIEDPREAILRFANVAREDPIFSTAYQHTQPTPIFAELTQEEQAEEERLGLAGNARYGGMDQLKQKLREREDKSKQ